MLIYVPVDFPHRSHVEKPRLAQVFNKAMSSTMSAVSYLQSKAVVGDIEGDHGGNVEINYPTMVSPYSILLYP